VAWLVGSGQFQDTSVTNYTIEPGETLCTNPHVDSVPSNVQTNCDGGLFEYFSRLYYTSPVLINTTPTIPTISTIANVSVSVGATATFNATVAGNPTPSCQWMKNGAIITTNGTTCSSYTTPATVSGDNGALFSLKATNSAGTATSNNATLTVTTCPVLTTTSGGSFTDGSGNVWTLAANGDATINGTVASNGQGTSSLTLRAGVTWGQDAGTGNWFSWNGSGFAGPFALPACS